MALGLDLVRKSDTSLTLRMQDLMGSNYRTIRITVGGTRRDVRFDSNGYSTEAVFSGLDAGNRYRCEWEVVSNGGTSKSGTEIYYTKAGTPTSFRASNITENSARLTWSKPRGTIKSVRIALRTSGGSLIRNYYPSTSDTSYTIDGLDGGTSYKVAILCTNMDDEEGVSTNTTFSTKKGVVKPPSAQSLNITPWENSIETSWRSVSGATRYTVEVYQWSNDKLMGREATSNLSATIGGLEEGVRYTVKAYSYNSSAGNSTPVTHNVWTKSARMGSVSATSTGDSISASWSSVKGAKKYRVVCRLGSKTGRAITNTTTTSTSYKFTGLSANTTYYVGVQGINGNGDEGVSNNTTLSTKSAPRPKPSTPSGVSATGYINTVNVRWNTVSGAKNYTIEIYDVFDKYQNIREVITSGNSTTISGLGAGKPYKAKVYCNDGYENSEPAWAKFNTKPAGITGFTARPSNNSISISWNRITEGSKSYRAVCRRGSSNGTIVEEKNLLGVKNDYTFTGLSEGVTYYVGVHGISLQGEYGTSGNAVVTTKSTVVTLLDAPRILKVTPDETDVTVTWGILRGAREFTAEIYKGDVHQNIVGIDTGLRMTINGLSEGQDYRLKLYAHDGTRNGKPAWENFSTKPARMGNINLTPASNSVSASWSSAKGASKYRVVIRRGTSSNGTLVKEDTTTSTSYNFTGLASGTDYYVGVHAISSSNVSGVSNNATTTTRMNLPSQPVGLTVNVTDETIQAMWKSSTDNVTINKYIIEVWEKKTNFITRTENVASKREATFTGLTSGTDYYVKLYANNSAGNSEPAWARAGTKPRPMGEIKIVELKHDRLVVKWDAVNGAKEYKVALRRGKTSIGGLVKTITTSSTSIDLSSHITDDQQYYVGVHAISYAGVDGVSNNVTFETPKKIVLAKPTGITASESGFVTMSSDNPQPSLLYSIKSSNGSKAYVTDQYITRGQSINMPSSMPLGESYILEASYKSNGVTSPITVVRFGLKPNKVDGLKLSAKDNSITANWSPANGAEKYKIVLRKGASTISHLVSSTTVTSNSYTFNELDKDTMYYVGVHAIGKNGIDGVSARETIKTTGSNVQPPSKLTILSVSPNEESIRVNWKIDRSVTEYVIETWQGGKNITHDVTKISSHTINGLKAETAYTIKLYGRNAGGNGVPIETESWTLPERVSVTVTAKTSNSVSFTTSPSKDARTKKIIALRKGNNSSGNLIKQWEIGAKDTSIITQTGLDELTEYYIGVRAVNHLGQSGVSQNTTFTTLKNTDLPPSISGLVVSADTDSVSISFQGQKNAKITEVYELFDKETGNVVEHKEVKSMESAHKYTFLRLNSNKEYMVKVYHRNDSGNGVPVTKTIWTSIAPPNLKITKIGKNKWSYHITPNVIPNGTLLKVYEMYGIKERSISVQKVESQNGLVSDLTRYDNKDSVRIKFILEIDANGQKVSSNVEYAQTEGVNSSKPHAISSLDSVNIVFDRDNVAKVSNEIRWSDASQVMLEVYEGKNDDDKNKLVYRDNIIGDAVRSGYTMPSNVFKRNEYYAFKFYGNNALGNGGVLKKTFVSYVSNFATVGTGVTVTDNKVYVSLATEGRDYSYIKVKVSYSDENNKNVAQTAEFKNDKEIYPIELEKKIGSNKNVHVEIRLGNKVGYEISYNTSTIAKDFSGKLEMPVASYSPNTNMLNWSAVDGATSYTVQLRGKLLNENIHTTNNATLLDEFYSLEPVIAVVIAHNGKVSSPPSIGIDIRLRFGKITYVKQPYTAPDVIPIDIEPLEGAVLYKVAVREVTNTGLNLTWDIKESKTRLSSKDFTPNRVYSMTVYAIDAYGSESNRFVTNMYTSKNGVPDIVFLDKFSLSISNLTTEHSISQNVKDGDVSKYKSTVELYNEVTGRLFDARRGLTGRTFTAKFTGLEASTKYKLKYYTNNGIANGNPMYKSFNTQPPSVSRINCEFIPNKGFHIKPNGIKVENDDIHLFDNFLLFVKNITQNKESKTIEVPKSAMQKGFHIPYYDFKNGDSVKIYMATVKNGWEVERYYYRTVNSKATTDTLSGEALKLSHKQERYDNGYVTLVVEPNGVDDSKVKTTTVEVYSHKSIAEQTLVYREVFNGLPKTAVVKNLIPNWMHKAKVYYNDGVANSKFVDYFFTAPPSAVNLNSYEKDGKLHLNWNSNDTSKSSEYSLSITTSSGKQIYSTTDYRVREYNYKYNGEEIVIVKFKYKVGSMYRETEYKINTKAVVSEPNIYPSGNGTLDILFPTEFTYTSSNGAKVNGKYLVEVYSQSSGKKVYGQEVDRLAQFKGLVQGETYVIQYKGVGGGANTHPTTKYYTSNDLVKPRIIILEARSNNTMYIRWSAGDDGVGLRPVDTYAVAISGNGKSDVVHQTYVTGKNFHTFLKDGDGKDFVNGGKYIMRVVAYDANSNNDSAFTKTMIFGADKPSQWEWHTRKVKGEPCIITAGEWNSLGIKVNQFRTWKKLKTIEFNEAFRNLPLTAMIYNEMLAAIKDMTKEGLPAPVKVGEEIEADKHLNSLVKAINAL